jgi:transposase
MTKRTNKHYPAEFKQEAVALVIEQDYSVAQAASSLGVTDKLLYNWVAKHKKDAQGEVVILPFLTVIKNRELSYC